MFIEDAIARASDEYRKAHTVVWQEKRKRARVLEADAKRWTRTVRWLRVLWHLSAGQPQLMRSAWIIQHEQLSSVWDLSDVSAEQIWRLVGQDIEMESLDVQEAGFLAEPTSKEERATWQSAWEFFAEFQLSIAVMTLNITKHMVASSDFMHRHFAGYLLAKHPAVPDAILAISESVLAKRSKPAALRQWLCRWRERWGFKYTKLPGRELMPPDKLSQKVAPQREARFEPQVGSKKRHAVKPEMASHVVPIRAVFLLVYDRKGAFLR
jgi:hypothetical protein